MAQTAIPREITQGDRIEWIDCFPSFSSSQYSLTYSLRGASILDLTAIANGSTFKTIITAIQSTGLVSGQYFFQAFITEIATGYRQIVGKGQLIVLENLAIATAPYDGRTYAEKTLLAIQNTITAKLEGGAVMEYRIGQRMVKNFTLKELREEESYWRNRVLQEQINNGDRPNSQNLLMGFD